MKQIGARSSTVISATSPHRGQLRQDRQLHLLTQLLRACLCTTARHCRRSIVCTASPRHPRMHSAHKWISSRECSSSALRVLVHRPRALRASLVAAQPHQFPPCLPSPLAAHAWGLAHQILILRTCRILNFHRSAADKESPSIFPPLDRRFHRRLRSEMIHSHVRWRLS